MRDYRIDLLRILAILAVLGIHCFGGKGNAADYVNGFCRFSVPVFVMISAICCAPKLVSTTTMVEFYKPRFVRVGAPLLMFSVCYAVWDLIAGCEWSYVAKNFVIGKPSYHLWFGFMILGVYVFMPFCAQLVSQIKHGLLALVSCFVILMTWHVGYGLFSILPFVAYALLAFLLRHRLYGLSNQKKSVRVIIGILFLFSYIICSIIAGSIGEHRAWTYTSIYSLIGSVSVLVVIFALLPQTANNRFCRVIETLSSFTLGVYLFHVIAIRGILRLIPRLGDSDIFMAMMLWAGVTISSFAVTFVAAKLP
ncbi:MAG: acyltransferase family protein, partial [Bacteroidales bacterium]|nr:acyltransferase family protein [Bacteroidales bacterium]